MHDLRPDRGKPFNSEEMQCLPNGTNEHNASETALTTKTYTPYATGPTKKKFFLLRKSILTQWYFMPATLTNNN